MKETKEKVIISINTVEIPHFTNNGIKIKKFTGCWNCKHLDYYEKDSYESLDENGWICNYREDVENFKDFPCKRKLKCFQEKKQKEDGITHTSKKVGILPEII